MGDKIKDFSVDSFHTAFNLGSELYTKAAQDVEKIEKQIAELQAKQNQTDEDKNQLTELNKQLISLQNQINRFNESPWRALSASAACSAPGSGGKCCRCFHGPYTQGRPVCFRFQTSDLIAPPASGESAPRRRQAPRCIVHGPRC